MAEATGTGGITTAEIQAFARIAELPQDAGASLDVRFCGDVAILVAARSKAAEAGKFSVFLRSESIHRDAGTIDCDPVPFLQNANDPISGFAWLSTLGLRSCFRLRLEMSTDAELTASIIEAGFGNMPAVVVDWRGGTPIGRLFRNGLANHDDAYVVSFEQHPISEQALKATLDEFYETVLRTPSSILQGNGTRIWGSNSDDARKGIPSHRPEERIQGRLLDRLKGAYPRHTWRGETPTEDGRADIVASRKAIANVSVRCGSPGFQLDGLNFQGSKSSMRFWG